MKQSIHPSIHPFIDRAARGKGTSPDIKTRLTESPTGRQRRGVPPSRKRVSHDATYDKKTDIQSLKDRILFSDMSRLIVFATVVLAVLSSLSFVHGTAESVTGQSEGRAAETCTTSADCGGNKVCSPAIGVCLDNVSSDVGDGVQPRGDSGAIGSDGGVTDVTDDNDDNDAREVDVDDGKVTVGSGGYRMVFNGAVVVGCVAMAIL